MSMQFYRSMRSLQADGPAGPVCAMALAFLLLGAWGCWALLAQVTRYEVTEGARLEIDESAYPIQASVGGRLIVSRLALGDEVKSGDVLVELEDEGERLALDEERTRNASFAPQIAVLHSQLAAQDNGHGKERNVLGFAVEEARQRLSEAEALAIFAEKSADRSAQLFKEGLVAVADDERSRAEARGKRAAAENLRIAVGRLEPELQVRESDRDSRRQQALGELARLETQEITSAAAVRRLEYEMERRRFRAPVSGRLGEVAMLRPGSYVGEGQKLGVILPTGKLRMVAEFAPASAFGRIRRGQPAVIRLEGFPWAQYGTVTATVARVASEVRDGKVRVELALNLDPRSRIPFQHGMPGSVEIETERISPATLAMRAAGGLVAGY